jgi:hypothetical protein
MEPPTYQNEERFSLTGAAPSSRALADRPGRRAAQRKTLYTIENPCVASGALGRSLECIGAAVLSVTYTCASKTTKPAAGSEILSVSPLR